MAVKVITIQLCPVWSAPAPHGARLGEILAGQEIEVQRLSGEDDKWGLIMAPPNLYPEYLRTGKKGYLEMAHVHPTGEPVPGSATLDGIMALVAKIAKQLGVE